MNMFTITPNKRLARTLANPAMSLADFLNTQLLDSGFKVLSPTHESYLWQHIIQQDTPSPLLNVSQAAELAKQAWDNLHLWEVPLTKIATSEDEQVQAFLRWAKQFNEICSKGWLTPSMLPNYFSSRPLKRNSQNHEAIGFEDHPPSVQNFFKHHHIPMKKNSYPPVKPFQCALDTPQDELLWVANEMRKYLKPQAKMLCVVPNLSERKIDLEYALWKTFGHELCYNISLGSPLNKHPFMQTAWTTLSLLSVSIPLDACISWLRSPIITENYGDSGELEWALYQLLEPNISLAQLKTLALPYCPNLSEPLQRLSTLTQSPIKKQNFSDWSELFSVALNAFDWDKKINALDSALFEQWQRLLSEFASIPIANISLSFEQALDEIKRQADSQTYQKAYQDYPIQIMGLLEAQNIVSDKTWVLGCQENHFPPAHAPNPFLPLSLQKSSHMPHASPDKEQIYYKALINNLIYHSKHIIFSYAKHHKGQIYRPSALIKSFEEYHPTIFSNTTHIPAKLETVPDQKAPEIPLNTLVRGGTSVLKHQAQCPFKAFSETRLNTQAIPTLGLGLQAFERGQLLHYALEKIWDRLKNQSNLINMAPENLEDLISSIAKTVVLTFSRKHPNLFTQTFAQLERTRLEKRILQSLNIDKKRPSFQVIAQEKTSVLSFAGLQFTTRLDRIDQLEGGHHFLIDYKTGSTSIQSWLDDQPDEPQLPFYAITSNHPISGIAFFEINAQKQQYKGIGEDILGIEGVYSVKKLHLSSWPDLISRWNDQLNQLAINYRLGVATVTPKDPKTTCHFCKLQSFCRI